MRTPRTLLLNRNEPAICEFAKLLEKDFMRLDGGKRGSIEVIEY